MFSGNPAFKRTLTALAVASALSVTGCGGGGGGDTPTTSTVSGVTLDGVAAKGIMWKADVVAKELSADGATVERTVGTDSTDQTGGYSITVADSYTGGPIQVTVSADGDTLMKCDAAASAPNGCGAFAAGDSNDTNANQVIDRGEWYAPGSVSISAAVPKAEKNQQIAVSVTPFTEMAVRRAKASGGLSESNIDAANNAISRMLDPNATAGLDILRTKPVDNTDSAAAGVAGPAENLYAAFNGAVADQAASTITAGGVMDIQTTIETVANKFTGDVDGADLQDLVDDASTQLTDSGVSDSSITSAVDDVQQTIDDAGSSGGQIALPTTTDPALASLAVVKNFVGDVRTWGHVIDTQLKTPSEAFAAQIDLANQGADIVTPGMLKAAYAAIYMAWGYGTGGSSDMSTYAAAAGVQSASGTVSEDSAGNIVINGTITPYHYADTVHMTVTPPGPLDAPSKNYTGGLDGTIENVAGKMTLSDLQAGMQYDTEQNIGVTTVNSANVPVPSTFTLQGGIELAQKMDLTGATATDPVTFTGDLDTTIAVKSTGVPDNELFVPQALTLSGGYSNTTGDSVTASLTATVDNLDSLDASASSETADNWLQVANIAVQFTAQLDGLPEAVFTVSNAARTSYANDFEGDLTIAYGAKSIKVAIPDTAGTSTPTATITSSDGVVFTMPTVSDGSGYDFAPSGGTIKYNGVKYADVTTVNGVLKVTYTDGTFVTL